MMDDHVQQDTGTSKKAYRETIHVVEHSEIDFVALFMKLWRWKWFIGSGTFCVGLLAVFVTLFIMQERFSANAVLQPLGQVVDQGGLARIASLFVGSTTQSTNKTRTILNYLGSRRLQLLLVKQFDLMAKLYPGEDMSSWGDWSVDQPPPMVVKALQRGVLSETFGYSFSEDSGQIKIYCRNVDPKLAARMVEWIIAELARYLEEDNVTDARRNREFIKEQLDKATESLERWERQVPTSELSATKIMREQQASVVIYTELKKQYELAKIEEDRELVAFKVVDLPMVPVLRFAPERAKICLLAMFFAGFLLTIFVFVLEFVLGRINDFKKTVSVR